MKFRLFFFIAAAFFAVQQPIQALELGPEARISILTCNPGKDVYSMYGHTAIRVCDPAQRIDVVYNYGVFSFESPNFMYRFAKGQTDYMMIGQRFDTFMPEYHQDKRSVYEQVLNLSAEGMNNLFRALRENARPENREYRYNFFTDNCATRVRDMIERNAGVQIQFTDHHPTETYRDLIKKFHHSFRWIDLGIDLLVGKKADVPVSAYQQMFLPEYLFNQFVSAQIIRDGKTESLISKTNVLAEYPNSKLNTELQAPTIAAGLLLAVFAVYLIFTWRKKKETDVLDFWILFISGLVGVIIGWFTLYSEHPAMSPNYNLLWAFPANLIFAWIWRVRKFRAYSRYYFGLIGALLMLSPWCGQVFNPAVYFLISILLVWVVKHLIPSKQ
jgi:hypothetical protein